MHFCHVIKPGPFRLTPGRTYLMDDKPAGQYLMMGMADHIWHTRHTHNKHLPYLVCPRHSPPQWQDLQGWTHEDLRVLIIRAGGLGDLLMITPSLARLQALHPHLHITVATTSQQAVTLPGIATTAYPVPLEEVEKHDLIIPLEGYIEDDNENDGALIFAQALGLIERSADTLVRSQNTSANSSEPNSVPTRPQPSPIPQSGTNFPLKPIFHPDPALVAEARERWPTDSRFPLRIGIQIRASADNRTYPANLLAELMERHLIPMGAQIFLFANPNPQPLSAAEQHPQIIRLPNLENAPSFALSAALLTTMDLVIAPDSAICHVAGALDIPTIALFGPFHWRQRTSHSPSIHALQGHAPCAPCHHHGWAGDPYPANQECFKKKHCLALASLTPDRIAAKVKQVLKPYSNRHE